MDAGDRGVMKMALTSVSAMVAETTTFPIDLLKTRLQLHGESMRSARPASTIRIALQVARNDGVWGMYRGLSPAIFRHTFYTPTRIIVYEHLRDNFVRSPDHSLSFYSKAVIGGISGAIAQVFITELIFSTCIGTASCICNSSFLYIHGIAFIFILEANGIYEQSENLCSFTSRS